MYVICICNVGMYCSKMIIDTALIFGTIVHLYNTNDSYHALGSYHYDHHLAVMYVKAAFAKIAILCLWPYSMTWDANNIHMFISYVRFLTTISYH